MPLKKGAKRKRNFENGNDDNSQTMENHLLPPNREEWPGWVLMESEPAFFNVMLKEMGVDGARVQEVFSLDEESLAFLPRPVYALIFLFKYKAGDDEGTGTECPENLWFANQIPDFACGTVALLNIINNIPNLQMGKELRDFRDFTKDMDPLSKGDALENFDFVRKIHNSFAREGDMLHADILMRDRVNKTKRKAAVAKAQLARKLKKAALTSLPPNVTTTPIRNSPRNPPARKRTASPETRSFSPSDPPDSDEEFKSTAKSQKRASPTGTKTSRKSARTPKPIKPASEDTLPSEDDEDGSFHFIAYMPIGESVWKLDGMDHFPQNIGSWEKNEDWLTIAAPLLRTRMAQHAAGGIEFNLMAVVPDPVASSQRELGRNIRSIAEFDRKLDDVFEDWRALEGAETGKDVLVGPSVEYGVTEAGIGISLMEESMARRLKKDDDLLRLVAARGEIVAQQAMLRAAVRDALMGSRSDEEEARHRRFDYGTFVKSWLGSLADEELLAGLLADA